MIETPYALISLFFVANFALPLHIDGSQGPFWSLSVEEQFYLVWPFVVRNFSTTVLRRLLFATIWIEPMVRILMTWKGHSVSYYTFTRCDGLAWGAVLALEYRSGRVAESGQWWRSRDAGILLLGFIIFAVAISIDQTDRWRTSLTLTAFPMIFVSIMGFVIGSPSSALAKLFRLRILCFFGEISYASYLVHIYVIRAYDHLAGPLQAGFTAPFLIRACVCLTVTTAVCSLSFYVFERPVMAARRRFLIKSPEGCTPDHVHLSTR
jgi:peptidoglycan/LPS O-acetylase OafA/YrhL